MIEILIDALYGTGYRREVQPCVPGLDKCCRQEEDAAGTVDNKESRPVSAEIDLDKDIKALVDVFGPLTEGKVIELTLSRLLEICPRRRRKQDAFITLRNRLRAYGVELRVIPNINVKDGKNCK